MIGADDTAEPPAKRLRTAQCHPFLLLQTTTPDGRTMALLRVRQYGAGYLNWRTPELEAAVTLMAFDPQSIAFVRRPSHILDADVHLAEDETGRYHVRLDDQRPVQMVEWPHSVVVLGGMARDEECTSVCTSFTQAYAQLLHIDDRFPDSSLEAYIVRTNELLTWNSDSDFGVPVEYM
jgi:hypothetical protein